MNVLFRFVGCGADINCLKRVVGVVEVVGGGAFCFAPNDVSVIIQVC